MPAVRGNIWPFLCKDSKSSVVNPQHIVNKLDNSFLFLHKYIFNSFLYFILLDLDLFIYIVLAR